MPAYRPTPWRWCTTKSPRLERVVEVGAAARAARAAVHPAATGEVGLGDEREPGAGHDDAPLERARPRRRPRRARSASRIGVDAVAGEHVARGAAAEPAPSAASTTRVPPRGQPREPLREARRCRRRPGRTPVAARCGVSGESGRRQHARRRRRAVCASSRSNGSDRRGQRRAPGAPQVAASVSASAASSSSSSCARSRMRRGSTSSTSASVGQQVGEEVLVVGEPRQPRLHAVEDLALGEALPLLARPTAAGRTSAAARSRTSVGRQQLARREDRAPRRPSSVERWSATENDDEPVDLVAPQVDADGVVGGRRVHVDDRAAHRDLAPRLDLVLAPVARRRRAARRARRGRPGRRARRRPARRPRRADRGAARAPAPARRGRPAGGRRPGAAATGRAAAGPSSRATATPARTAASPTPGTARPGRPTAGTGEVVREALGLRRGRDGDEDRPAAVAGGAAATPAGPSGTATAERGDARRPARRTRDRESPGAMTARTGRASSASRAGSAVQGGTRRWVSVVVTGSSRQLNRFIAASTALGDDRLDGVGGLLDRDVDLGPLPLREPGEHVVGALLLGGAACRRRCGPAGSRRVCRCAMIDRSPLWPASPPPSFSLQRGDRQVELVVDDDELLRLDAVAADERAAPPRRSRSCT